MPIRKEGLRELFNPNNYWPLSKKATLKTLHYADYSRDDLDQAETFTT